MKSFDSWIDLFRMSGFKYIVLGISLAALEVFYYFKAYSILRCNPETNICYSGINNLLIYNLTKIIPILIAIYLLASLAEFLYRIYIRIEPEKER